MKAAPRPCAEGLPFKRPVANVAWFADVACPATMPLTLSVHEENFTPFAPLMGRGVEVGHNVEKSVIGKLRRNRCDNTVSPHLQGNEE